MQLNNDLQQLRSQITRSPLLTQIEKAEWLQLMGEMTEAQSSELSAILVASEQALEQVNQQNSQKAQVAKQQQAAALQQVIQRNLEKSQEQPQEQLQPSTQSATQPDWRAQIAEQQKNLLGSSSGLKLKLDSSEEVSGADLPQEPLMQAVQPSQAPKPASAPQKAAPQHPSFEIKTPDDLSNLPVDYLRQGDPKANLEDLLQRIANLTHHYKFNSFIGKIEQSPLYKEYSKLGLTILNDTQENRDAIYQSYQRNAAQHSQPYLTKEEFEAFTDFRKAEDRILG
jgi:hypothetical protein